MTIIDYERMNDTIPVGIPRKVLITAGIPDHNVVTFSARKGIITIEDTGMTAEEMEQCGCDCVCGECRERMMKERGIK